MTVQAFCLIVWKVPRVSQERREKKEYRFRDPKIFGEILNIINISELKKKGFITLQTTLLFGTELYPSFLKFSLIFYEVFPIFMRCFILFWDCFAFGCHILSDRDPLKFLRDFFCHRGDS